ncbi:HAD-IIIA family hydrolase [Brevundimonas sp. SGAir0440]|uniref:HAD-IIIA family hydrolase n=1 Tax=Brevundimonas sp. SGAir0440 TaxID=2579977 RepID=UPI0010CD0F15|nr:HAD-IIIA family hydrolase [Brevundimonas sp. SGAir0440]QCQ97583.1 HAD-IIIA family hydrolase [Brevundimonas sp. SGAir0440]
MQAVILAGGKGTRLAPRLDGRPKPLVDVCGRPLLARQLEALEAHGVEEVLLLVSHKAEMIAAFVEERENLAHIQLIDDGEGRGTAGALLAVYRRLKERFLVVYGDTLFDIDIHHMVDHHLATGADVTLLLHPNDHPADSDLVEMDGRGWISRFHAYPHPEGSVLGNLVNGAFYVCERDAIESWQDMQAPCDLAKDLFPQMLAAGRRLKGYKSHEYIKDLGTPARLDKAERHLRGGVVSRASRRHLQKAVFLDRDGTLNALNGYITHPDSLELFRGAGATVKRLNDAEYRVIVATNQPVLARGECDDETLQRIHAKIETELGRAGAYLDDIRVCPHHPDGGFAGEVKELKCLCDCRKPAPGLLLQAARDMRIDLRRSWMVGDSSVDLACAREAGVSSVLVLTGEMGRDGRCSAAPDFVAADIGAAVSLILDQVPAAEAAASAWLSDLPAGVVLIFSGGSDQARRSVRALFRRIENVKTEGLSSNFEFGGGDRKQRLNVDVAYWAAMLS